MTASLLSMPAERLQIPLAETLRYSGVRGEADAFLQSLAQSCMEEVAEIAVCKACYARLPVDISGERLMIGDCCVRSSSLARHIQHCSEVFLFAATLGAGVDRAIQKYSLLKPSKGVVFDGAASAAIEAWCDQVDVCLQEQVKEVGTLRARFSPGYGNFPLSFQRDIVELLDCQRNLGLTLSDSLLLVPTKSVTAVVGIQERELNKNERESV